MRTGRLLIVGGGAPSRGVSLPGGPPCGGVSLPGGGAFGIPAVTEADPINRMTDRCKNITLATTSLRPVITITVGEKRELDTNQSAFCR